MISREILLPFEELILKKRGGTKTLKTVEENRDMILYIVETILGLNEEEFRALYSTDFNNRCHLTKYITQLLNLADEESLIGTKRSKDYILYLLYPSKEKIDMQKEIIRLLNNNDEATKKHLDKIKDDKKRDYIMFSYLEWLFDEVMEMHTQEERLLFLSKAEELRFSERIPCFSVVDGKYFCLLDFYFYNLPKKMQHSMFSDYLGYRKNIPAGLEVLKEVLKDDAYMLELIAQ